MTPSTPSKTLLRLPLLILAAGLSVAMPASYAIAADKSEATSKSTDKKPKTIKVRKARPVDTKLSNATLPGSQYQIEVTASTETLPFRAHGHGLSDNQRRALEGVARRAGWANDNPISLELISSHDLQSTTSALGIRQYLLDHGVADEDIKISHAQTVPADIVNVNVITYAVKPILCGQHWENLGATLQNQVYDNFGCSLTANLAAEINDPRHVLKPATSTPVDVNRRNVIMQKYREGQVTSSADNAAATARISQAIQ